MILIKIVCWFSNFCNFKNVFNVGEEYVDVRNGLGFYYNSNRINKEKDCEVIKIKLS